MDAKLFIMIGVAVVLAALIGAAEVYRAGYKSALRDYVNGTIDCVIKVQYPELLRKETE